MIAKKAFNSWTRDAAIRLDKFVCRTRRKMTSRDHKFKETDRIDIYARYPQYKEETLEEKKAVSRVELDWKTLVNKDDNSEFMETLRRFLEFIKRIFKKV